MTKNIADLRPDGEKFHISLAKLTGLGIKDLHGYITTEFGGFTFELSEIEFSDGSTCAIEGEHDCPYIMTYPRQPIPGLDEITMRDLYRQENGPNEEDEDAA